VNEDILVTAKNLDMSPRSKKRLLKTAGKTERIASRVKIASDTYEHEIQPPSNQPERMSQTFLNVSNISMHNVEG
jgi:hypothetical protein